MLRKAAELAQRYGWTGVPRRRDSVRQLFRKYNDNELVLVTGKELNYYRGSDPPVFFHPSMAQLRIKRMMKGEPDFLLSLLEVAPGDTVLDCTAGLASDSIVFSYASGPQGQVTALESAPVLAMLLKEGLADYRSGLEEVDAAMRRIRIVQGNHLDYLRQAGERSVDIVYFDPMFRTPIEQSDSLSPLRNMANADALSREAVEEARRVARRAVVLKEHRGSPEFARLGFPVVERSGSKIAYGVIKR